MAAWKSRRTKPKEPIPIGPRDAGLIATAGQAGGKYADEASREAMATLIVDLKNAVVAEQEATTELTERIWWLNVWLLVVSLVIGGLAILQLLAALGILHR